MDGCDLVNSTAARPAQTFSPRVAVTVDLKTEPHIELACCDFDVILVWSALRAGPVGCPSGPWAESPQNHTCENTCENKRSSKCDESLITRLKYPWHLVTFSGGV
jgi:hypothetical protein